MRKITHQLKKWTTSFGQEYTNRNALSLTGLEKLYSKQFGITRTEMNKKSLSKLDRSIRILEVGCNIGNQLLLLQNMGFKNLFGIEPQGYAAEIARKRTKGINIIQNNAFDLAFKDNYFDLVFTSGVLIHIAPKDIKEAMKEIYRCSNKFIWGFEYYSKQYKNISYRKEKGLLWKADFSQLYLDLFHDLKLIKKMTFKYSDSDNEDMMFLLQKK